MLDCVRSTEEWISLISLAIALLSAFFAGTSAIVAHGSFRMLRDQDTRSKIQMSASFGQQVIKEIEDGRVLLLDVKIRNPSTSANSVTDAQLEVLYDQGNGMLVYFVIPYGHDLPDSERDSVSEPVDFPVEVGPGGSTSKRLGFHVPKSLNQGKMRGYKLVFHDAMERTFRAESFYPIFQDHTKEESD
ncbi:MULTISPECIES: DUF4352 domain-containing protein [Nocardiopsis]|uniref:hypothetical protein n=1 Tax=Nocardiopsis TaxID=2013 RepID=UPI001180256E|nr:MULTISPECIES: hypothetical protein [Nocardiopsis]